MGLKKSHPFRLIEGAERQNGLVPHQPMDENLEGISQEQGVPAPHQVPPAQSSGARKISPHNFWLQNPAGIESVEETSRVSSSPLKEPTPGFTKTHSL